MEQNFSYFLVVAQSCSEYQKRTRINSVTTMVLSLQGRRQEKPIVSITETPGHVKNMEFLMRLRKKDNVASRNLQKPSNLVNPMRDNEDPKTNIEKQPLLLSKI